MTTSKIFRSLLFLLLLAAAAPPMQAQTQELSREQILNNDYEGIVNPLPRVVEWTDNNRFILARPGENGGYEFFTVDAETGEEEPYTPQPQPPSVEVEAEEGDIWLRTGDTSRRLTETAAEENNPTLSPDETKVAFTRDRDLYVLDIDSGEELRITEDGSDVIYNGWSSWVYMEEILGRSTRFKAFWWSPDSERIAFMRFDDSPVPVFPIHSAEGSYGTLIEQRYPKAGFDNPLVRIGVADANEGGITWADFDEEDDQYFGMPYWRPDAGAVWVQWMNRDQDHLVIYEMDLQDGGKSVIYEERQDTWIDLDSGSRLQFLENGNGFLLMSDKSGWMHLYHHDMGGNLVSRISDGEWSVTDLERVNEDEGTLVFSARRENSARSDLYRVNLDGSGLQRMTFGEFHHSTSISPDGNRYVTNYSNHNTPARVALADHSGNVIRDLGDSKGEEYDNYQLSRTELHRVETEDGFDLPVSVTWPADLDENGSYPVIISIYGGPGSTGVMDSWRGVGFSEWWAKEDLIQVRMDHRGSGHFGKEGKNYMHRDLGNWEIQDYSTIVEWLQNTYPFIDRERIGITGFSYGGYISALALAKAPGTFDFGLAGGSVTDWHLYDTHYTERYMDRPQDNPEGYESSSVMTWVDDYEGYLLMVHGTMDDNVHLQNSLQLVGALESAGKEFTFIPYIGGKHGWGNLPGKQRHYTHERYRFYYRHLLEKPVPGILVGEPEEETAGSR